eukprot:3587023-Rhodomonas_salina.1
MNKPSGAVSVAVECSAGTFCPPRNSLLQFAVLHFWVSLLCAQPASATPARAEIVQLGVDCCFATQRYR